MRPRRTSTQSTGHRRIGRKALQADHLSHAIEKNSSSNGNSWLSLPSWQPKIIAAVCVVIVGGSLLGFMGMQAYLSNISASQKVSAAVQQSKLKAKSIAIDACHRKKAAEKADQIGKITYDELYDHDECDKQ
jgi:hypothetical protein